MYLPHPARAVALQGLLGVAACAGILRRAPADSRFPLAKPDSALLAAAGPDSFTVRFTTSRGIFDVRVHRDWAPRGADRIYYLAKSHFYDAVRFFRVVNGSNGRPFVAQWGLHGDTAIGRAWRGLRLQDDPAVKSNVRGTLSFAAGGANTRTTQIYVNFGDNSRLDTLRFAVFGQVIRGMDSVVDSLYRGYPNVPNQGTIGREGNAYLLREYPKLDFISTARVIQEWRERR